VLCVDDNEELLSLTATGLERESDRISVVRATSVEAGLEAFRERSIDCVVSDYHMPDGSGVDLLCAVREVDGDLPFVIYTETGNETVASEAISAGVTDYVVRKAVENQHALLARKVLSHVDRRHSEKRAARTERRLLELSAVSNDVLWTFSGDWEELLFINDVYEELFGQSTETLAADPTAFLEPVHDDDIDRVQESMRRVSEGETRRVEFRVRQSEAVTIWVESFCVPVVEDGTVERLTGFTRDVTERKVRERELAGTNERLEEFATTVAHDLRNPLNVAHGNLELVQAERDDDRLGKASDAITNASDLLDELLSLARTGRTVGDRTSVPLADLVEAAELDVNTRATAASIEVANSGAVRCDSTRLKEALANLFRNAIEHNEAGVTIRVEMLPDGDGFYVEDDGVGIPAEQRDAVFESGYTDAKAGTGFGLAIVDRVIDAHGWEIDVTEGDRGGARFDITGLADA